MERDVGGLLAHLLEDGEVTEDQATELVQALAAADTGSEIQAELDTEIVLRELLAREGDLERSRERLLAKTALGGGRGSWPLARGLGRRPVAWAAAAAVLIASAVGTYCRFTRPRPYPGISVSGDFAVGVGAARAVRGETLARGERVVAGPGGARLTLGGYCNLTLDNGTEVVVRGGPGEEVVQVDLGRVRSKVSPGQGRYRVLTPAGELDVIGTEFVTTVEHKQGAAMNARSVVVSVAVLAGVVGFDFGGQTGILSAGTNRVFAAEVVQGAGADSPSQTKVGVVRKVDLEARAIVVMVTRELTFTITDGTEIRQGDAPATLADIRVGDTVSVLYSFDPARNRVASRVAITGRGDGGAGRARE